jgi:phosphate uptake regulator
MEKGFEKKIEKVLEAADNVFGDLHERFKDDVDETLNKSPKRALYSLLMTKDIKRMAEDLVTMIHNLYAVITDCAGCDKKDKCTGFKEIDDLVENALNAVKRDDN